MDFGGTFGTMDKRIYDMGHKDINSKSLFDPKLVEHPCHTMSLMEFTSGSTDVYNVTCFVYLF
jgi:hypothetical protein